MRTTVDREQLRVSQLPDAAWAAQVFEQLAIPDTHPFFVRSDGTDNGYQRLNAYLHELSVTGGRLPSSVTTTSYQLAKAATFIAQRHHDVRCACNSLEDCADGAVELTSATREDLRAYQAIRRDEVSSATWNNQASALSGFFRYARSAGWIDHDPIPRWGSRQRNTLVRPVDDRRDPHHLTQPQLHSFLTDGLRGDSTDQPPLTLERDYVFGLTLAATGLRVSEATLLLDVELPTATESDLEATLIKRRVKGGKLGQVIFTAELAHAIDHYRATERRAVVEASQPKLRRRLRDDQLIVVDRTLRGANPALRLNGRKTPTHHLNEGARALAVELLPDGHIEPLALFLGRTAAPISRRQWAGVFADADQRVRSTPDRAELPAHFTVTPHVMRHTFAIQMLAALMQLGRERASDPYHLVTNPLLTVQALLRHADPQTTMRYLRAAEGYDAHVPIALQAVVASLTRNAT